MIRMFQLFFLLFLFASLAKRNVIDYMNRSLNPERRREHQGLVLVSYGTTNCSK